MVRMPNSPPTSSPLRKQTVNRARPPRQQAHSLPQALARECGTDELAGERGSGRSPASASPAPAPSSQLRPPPRPESTGHVGTQDALRKRRRREAVAGQFLYCAPDPRRARRLPARAAAARRRPDGGVARRHRLVRHLDERQRRLFAGLDPCGWGGDRATLLHRPVDRRRRPAAGVRSPGAARGRRSDADGKKNAGSPRPHANGPTRHQPVLACGWPRRLLHATSSGTSPHCATGTGPTTRRVVRRRRSSLGLVLAIGVWLRVPQIGAVDCPSCTTGMSLCNN